MSDTLGSVGESAVLAAIFPRLPSAAAEILGPGDDAAVVATPDGRVVITTDMMIHGPDFRLAWSSAHDLGVKAAASNLADVAAMGAVPTALVVALAAPADTEVSFLEEFADGLRDGCSTLAPGCGVVGGDLSVSATLTIAVTAFGDLEGREPVTRSGARPGDVVAVSGVLGAAAHGLQLLFGSAPSPEAGAAARVRAEHPEAVAAQLAPRPPIADGPAAARAGATAMLDLSDGLAIDARRLAVASGVALDLSASAIAEGFPFDEPHDPRLCLDGGEDHSLLATFPPGVTLPAGFRRLGVVLEAGAHEGRGLEGDQLPGDELPGAELPGNQLPGGELAGSPNPVVPPEGDQLPGSPNPVVPPEGDQLPGAQLMGTPLPGVELRGDQLRGDQLSGDQLPGTALPGAQPAGAPLAGSLLIDGVPYLARSGWDPYENWDGAAG